MKLVPRTSFDGPELRFDFPGLDIGVAEYEEGPTGCTVLSFPGGPVPCSVDVRGGSPAVSSAGVDFVDAICLAGGSLYGLEAAAGVAAEELARREYRTDWLAIPLVLIGCDRDRTIGLATAPRAYRPRPGLTAPGPSPAARPVPSRTARA